MGIPRRNLTGVPGIPDCTVGLGAPGAPDRAGRLC